MELLIVVLLVVLVAISIGLGYFYVKQQKDSEMRRQEDKTLLLLQNQLHEMMKHFNERMREHNETLNKQFGVSTKVLQDINVSSSRIIKEVTERLAKLDETNKRVVSFAEQMKSLENILKNPKQRGILGEIFLENMLSSVLAPEHFRMQYLFESDRKIVDAVVFFADKTIPIDAKFSLDIYNQIAEETDIGRREQLEKEFKQAIKLRIDETSKYVRPSEGTTDFAMMFIPADGLFYSLLANRVGALQINTNNLIEYAFSKKVVIVSPMTFYAYLQTFMQSLNKLNVSKNVDEIIKRIGMLAKHLKAYDAYMSGLGKSLETTVNKYNTAYTEFKKVDKDVYAITDRVEGGEIEILQLEKPRIDN